MNEKKYKEAVDDIKVSEELKNETFHKMINQKRKNNVVKMLAMCAVFLLVVSVSYIEFDKNKDKNIIVNDDNKQVAKEEIDLPRFNSMEELKDPGVRYGHHKIIKDKTLLHLPGTGEEQRF